MPPGFFHRDNFQMETATSYFNSSLGVLRISADEKGITEVHFSKEKERRENGDHPFVRECMTQLEDYFSGKLREFDLPLNPAGTAFQLKVWKALLDIPYGKTISYLELAMTVGDKNSTRAVGSANGKNPIAIIIPCHRVIGHDGKLTGYGGGLWRKEWLLEHEGVLQRSKQVSMF